MEFLYLLEKIRFPGLNEIMMAITELGGELPFLVVAMIIYWCVDKRRGYYVLSVGFMGTITVQFMKLWFRVPRPWVLDPEFTILEEARAGAGGYSFPSGHTQSSVGTFGAVTVTTKKKWIRIAALAAAILVPFSRMYIGVHTPADVLTAAAISVGYLLLMHPLVYRNDGKYFPGLMAVMTVLAGAFIVFVEYYPFSADIDQHNLVSGLKSAYTLFGSLLGLILAYTVDVRKLHFRTDAIWWAQILKVALGFAAVLLVKEGLRAPLDALFAGHMAARGVRYFLVVVMAGVIWPITFKWFSELGRK